MKNLLEEYVERFGVHPPKLMMTSYEDDIYQKLLQDALEDDIPITGEDVEEAYEDVAIDIVRKEEK